MAALFTASLKYHAPGSYTFGSIPTAQYTGSITYVPVEASSGYWMFSAAAFGIGMTIFSPYPIRAIADTGTSLILVDPALASFYYAHIPGAQLQSGSYMYPCNVTPPNFVLVIGTYKAVVPGRVITYAPVGGGSELNLLWRCLVADSVHSSVLRWYSDKQWYRCSDPWRRLSQITIRGI